MTILPMMLAAAATLPEAAPLWESMPPVPALVETCPLPASAWGTGLPASAPGGDSNEIGLAPGMLSWNGLPIDERTLVAYVEAVAVMQPRPRTVLYVTNTDCAEVRRIAVLIAGKIGCAPQSCTVIFGPPPAPPAPPPPPSVSKRTVPKGSPQNWVTQDDYPPEGLWKFMIGTTGFRLDVSSSGKVTNCTVTSSSGHALLDTTTCRLLRSRARFVPAEDAQGRKIPSTWSSRFQWHLTSITSPVASWARASRYRIDASGAVSECERPVFGPAPFAYVGHCDYPVRRLLDPAKWRGKPVRVEVLAVHQVEGSPLDMPQPKGEILYQYSVSYTIDAKGNVAGCTIEKISKTDPFKLRKHECHPGLSYPPWESGAGGRPVRFTVTVAVEPALDAR